MQMVRLENDVAVELLPKSIQTVGEVEYWFNKDFAAQCTEAPDNVAQGWVYKDGVFTAPVETVPIPSEQRKTEYATRRCIIWENDILTIDGANVLYAAYLAEGDTAKAAAIQALIIEQKTVIRAEIPDSEL